MKDKQISEAGAPAGAPRQRPTSSSYGILVVDDDSDTRLLYGFVLTRPGYHIEVADGKASRQPLVYGCDDLSGKYPTVNPTLASTASCLKMMPP